MAVHEPPQMNATTTPDEHATAKNGDFAGGADQRRAHRETMAQALPGSGPGG